MATDRQIAANQRNAALSTGPKTEAGKIASRSNAIRHGMACESIGVEAEQSPAFQTRRDSWSVHFGASDEVEDWALERVVAASFRIERCELAMQTLTRSTAERARLAWDQDKALEAAKHGSRLSKNPSLIVRKLEATWHGVNLMLDWWTRLDEALKAGEDWSDAQSSIALDLLGVPRALRTGRTPINDPEGKGGPNLAYRLTVVAREIARLEQLQDSALEPLDDLECQMAASGDSALLGAPARLILRYEREAWRRYRESRRELKAAEPLPVPVSKPKPVAEIQPEPRARPAPAPAPRPQAMAKPDIDDIDIDIDIDDDVDEEMLEVLLAENAAMMRELGFPAFASHNNQGAGRNDGTNPIGCPGATSMMPAMPARSS